jgi:hypothetical protein
MPQPVEQALVLRREALAVASMAAVATGASIGCFGWYTLAASWREYSIALRSFLCYSLTALA